MMSVKGHTLTCILILNKKIIKVIIIIIIIIRIIIIIYTLF